jgi:hypothetical protein
VKYFLPITFFNTDFAAQKKTNRVMPTTALPVQKAKQVLLHLPTVIATRDGRLVNG